MTHPKAFTHGSKEMIALQLFIRQTFTTWTVALTFFDYQMQGQVTTIILSWEQYMLLYGT